MARLLQPVDHGNCFVLFSCVQDDMNLTEERKAPLRDKRLDEKRELLAMQFKGSIQVNVILMHAFCVFNCLCHIALSLMHHFC